MEHPPDDGTPRDDDPSGMTDFEKNATLGELERMDQPASSDESMAELPERQRQERGNRGPDEEPGFGQGA